MPIIFLGRFGSLQLSRRALNMKPAAPPDTRRGDAGEIAAKRSGDDAGWSERNYRWRDGPANGCSKNETQDLPRRQGKHERADQQHQNTRRDDAGEIAAEWRGDDAARDQRYDDL